MQRLSDIILSLIVLLILSPLFLIIMIVLKFSGEGEVFYRQQRIGRGGNVFGVFKFATMMKNSSKMGTGFITTKNDPRVLPFGRILRKTKLNEIPQILNVLIGDMSFVGPRPQVPKHFAIYSEQVQKELNKVRPGLTGIGSIFFRDEESILERNKHLPYEECYSRIIAPYKGQLELWYLNHKSMGLYFFLILLTAWVVVFPHSKLPMRQFKSLPSAPPELQRY
jgi:lipopolysaccharide/colanic/teichoic acid biosynthesis glycosyltransferase